MTALAELIDIFPDMFPPQKDVCMCVCVCMFVFVCLCSCVSVVSCMCVGVTLSDSPTSM